VGDATCSCDFVSAVIEGDDSVRRAQSRSGAILFVELALRIESRPELGGSRQRDKLGIETGMPTSRRRK
jgi:hypothetical protein